MWWSGDRTTYVVHVCRRGRNCLHMLCANPSSNASTVFAMLKNEAPNYPLDQQDDEGNTPLLLAYMGGNTALCDALVQAHAHPSICNRQNVSIFNAPVATKQLLFRLLGKCVKPNEVWDIFTLDRSNTQRTSMAGGAELYGVWHQVQHIAQKAPLVSRGLLVVCWQNIVFPVVTVADCCATSARHSKCPLSNLTSTSPSECVKYVATCFA